ncbi:efflux RND transporter periplasmic adaptor subunit [Actinophytocola xanthii]|uniref:efflux RND transporter periplasmic adaptor subunit n=1 Tax=Actinophytocola xanthii TaxID=1912961 RepID=UPI00130184E9|nr:efflux RND transporter periplasmic adaptor subunit [Actinophytocola xanthii]
MVWLAVAVVLVAAGAGAWWLWWPEPSEAEGSTTTAAASVGPQRRTVSATGTVEPAHRADLTFGVSGEVDQVLVAEGDTVRAGQVVATVDDELLRAEEAAAAAELEAAQARRDDDEAAGASDTQLAADEAAVVSADSRLAAARESLERAELTATIAGTVVEVDIAVGDQVSGDAPPDSESDSASPESGSGTITVVSPNRFVVEAELAATAVEEVKAGMAAEVVPVDAAEPVDGTVRSVALVAEVDEAGVASFPVTVEVAGEHEDLFAGSSATVAVVVEEREDVLTVPSQAIRQEDGATFVDLVVDGRTVRTEVEVGTAYGPNTEIRSGLEEGDEVELPGFVRGPGGNDEQGEPGDMKILPGGGTGPGGPVVRKGP